jgi:hypothetical protein
MPISVMTGLTTTWSASTGSPRASVIWIVAVRRPSDAASRSSWTW